MGPDGLTLKQRRRRRCISFRNSWVTTTEQSAILNARRHLSIIPLSFTVFQRLRTKQKQPGATHCGDSVRTKRAGAAGWHPGRGPHPHDCPTRGHSLVTFRRVNLDLQSARFDHEPDPRDRPARPPTFAPLCTVTDTRTGQQGRETNKAHT